MYRLFAVVIVALAGAAIWRRKEIRSDAERASKALAGAANSARSRIRPDPDQADDIGGGAAGDGGATAADAVESDEQAADAVSSNS